LTDTALQPDLPSCAKTRKVVQDHCVNQSAACAVWGTGTIEVSGLFLMPWLFWSMSCSGLALLGTARRFLMPWVVWFRR